MSHGRPSRAGCGRVARNRSAMAPSVPVRARSWVSYAAGRTLTAHRDPGGSVRDNACFACLWWRGKVTDSVVRRRVEVTDIAANAQVRDRLSRSIRDLRISVTDRCNFRCTYCMPREIFGPDHQFADRSELLRYEEIARLVRAFARLGVTKIRLTGGEPLLRRQLERLVAMIACIPGLDLTLTTNGSLLPEKAQALKEAGLRRVTVSLDSLDDKVFRAMNDVDFAVERV